MKRTFIAFDIHPSSDTIIAYDNLRQRLKFETINWTPADRFHITIKFLGETAEKDLPAIYTILMKALEGFSTFTVTLKGLGLFKSIHVPRVLWMGCSYDSGLDQIHKVINHELIAFGFESETRPFRPHLTLGRLRHIRQVNHFNELITLYEEKEFQKLVIHEIVLYESHLSPAGARYVVLNKFKLH
jgi:RNA 2',3'-cyclic 3'-phosphodiesterase